MSASSLKVAIDGRPLVGQRTGIGVHTAEIAGRLRFDPPPLIASHAEIEDRSGIADCRFAVDPAPLGVWWQMLRFPTVAARDGCDVVWGPHGTLPPTLRIPAVVSMHDLTSIHQPHLHRLKTIASFNLLIRRSLEMARFIAAVSRTTAEEVIRGFAIEREKVMVVPNGVDSFFSPGVEDQRGEYLLFVGTLEPRKGLEDLLAAWELLSRRPRLVIAGSAGWHYRRLRRYIQKYVQSGEITLAGFVERKMLRGLYRGAACLIYPSRYEGFGLPPLEAMACGTPVITSRAGALPETVGDAALTFHAGDVVDLSMLIGRVLAEPALRAEMRERGIRRAATFRWDRSAELMQDLLLRAAE